MKAIGYAQCGPITGTGPLLDIELPMPEPGPRDLLVAIEAVSVNPVDAKLRAASAPDDGGHRVLGFDASGTVRAVGSLVTRFAVGDAVFYAGALDRPGSNAEYQCVDERIVGLKPASLSFEEAAALPLTAITAWELLFDRLGVTESTAPGGTLLVINGAGGVGSVLTQLARQLTSLTVIATASRPETAAWCRRMGAHHVIDHRNPLDAALRDIGMRDIDLVASLTATEANLPAITDLIAPQGKLAVIDDPKTLDIVGLKRKSVAVHWELMFTRSLFQTPDMHHQHLLLQSIARLIDNGALRTTLTSRAGAINGANLRAAHRAVEGGRSIGKTVLAGF